MEHAQLMLVGAGGCGAWVRKKIIIGGKKEWWIRPKIKKWFCPKKNNEMGGGREMG